MAVVSFVKFPLLLLLKYEEEKKMKKKQQVAVKKSEKARFKGGTVLNALPPVNLPSVTNTNVPPVHEAIPAAVTAANLPAVTEAIKPCVTTAKPAAVPVQMEAVEI